MTTQPSRRPEETRVGAYRLLSPLGEGGMGVVHLAQGPDGRRVALKVMRPHIVGDAQARERLAQEVRSLRRITSPRIAEILDADPHGPVPFVVTRYVPGLSLHHHVAEEGTISGVDLLHFAEALAEALQAVHLVGVLHRDIKPTNVLMEGRSPVLIDFGLARMAEDPRLTQTGWLLGTPGYLAPEILYGDDATVASDVHSWAATVVFAATGRSPYGKGPSMAIMDRVRLGEFNVTGVPEPLASLLRRCLAAEPVRRPSVPELREQLRVMGQASRAAPAPLEREEWTMPFAAAAAPPATRVLPVEPPVVEPRATRAQPALPDQGVPRPQQARVPHPAEARPPSGAQRVLALVGLGLLTSAVVGYAPYAGTALVAVVVLLLRTASVTRERHSRRRLVRGRPRWYDVPTTTLSVPGYLMLAFFGTLSVIAVATLAGLAMFSLGYLLGQPMPVGMLLAGLGFAPALWWGPGSGRVREVTRGLASRVSRTELGGWFTAAACLLGVAVLVGMLLSGGPSWAPAVSGPWR